MPPVVELAGVTAERGGCVVLTVDALTIGTGITAVVGPNGSGKSTLLHLIAGLLAPVTGTVSIGGRPAAEGNPRVAYVLQSQASADRLPVTAREVVALGRAPHRGAFWPLTRADRRAVDRALDRMEVTDLADRHLADMSGGQRQRVLIAQGLAQEAEVLLFDEPTAGLDIASIQTIRREIEVERAAGRAVLVATHDLGEAAEADAAVLVAGHVVAAGEPATVVTPEHLVAAYAGRLVAVDGLPTMLDDGAHHDHEHHHDHHDHHDEHEHVAADRNSNE